MNRMTASGEFFFHHFAADVVLVLGRARLVAVVDVAGHDGAAFDEAKVFGILQNFVHAVRISQDVL